MALNIPINGSNYVSDRRREAFENALQEQAGQLLGAEVPEVSREAVQSVPATGHRAGSEVREAPVMQEPRAVLSRLDRALEQSYEHQTLTMRVHEQYLNNQSDYANIFSELMKQQGTIFADGFGSGGAAPQQVEVTAAVLNTLSRSMTRFHDLQEQTLEVHRQFLTQQSEYARAAIQLLQQQETAVPQNGGNGNGHKPPFNVQQTQIKKQDSGNGKRPTEISTREQPSVVQEAPVERVVAQAVSPAPVPEPVVATPAAEALAAPDVSALTDSLLAIVSDKTGYPADMLELEMDMESDLGIDSIKRVEILGALQDAHPDLPEVPTDVLAELRTLGQIVERLQISGGEMQTAVFASPVPESRVLEPVAAPAFDASLLTDSLLAIVSDKTGYPADMLELEMDMESDLGIDSIKRVEILGALQDAHPDLPEVPTDVLAELRTLGQIVERLQASGSVEQVPVEAQPAPAFATSKKA